MGRRFPSCASAHDPGPCPCPRRDPVDKRAKEALCSLTLIAFIETAKLQGIDPGAYLRDVLTRIAQITRSTASPMCCPGIGSRHASCRSSLRAVTSRLQITFAEMRCPRARRPRLVTRLEPLDDA